MTPPLPPDELLTTTRAVRKRLDLSRPVPRALLAECVRVAAQAPGGRLRVRGRHADSLGTRGGLASRVGYRPSHRGNSPAGPTRADGGEHWQRISESADHLDQVLHRVPVLLAPVLRVESREEFSSFRGQAGVWGSVLPAFWSFMLAAREPGLGTA
jgi:nitroreductase